MSKMSSVEIATCKLAPTYPSINGNYIEPNALKKAIGDYFDKYKDSHIMPEITFDSEGEVVGDLLSIDFDNNEAEIILRANGVTKESLKNRMVGFSTVGHCKNQVVDGQVVKDDRNIPKTEFVPDRVDSIKVISNFTIEDCRDYESKKEDN